MAGEALGRDRHELAGGAAFVAGVAVDSGVSSGQRKTIVVLLDVLIRHLPSAHGVALFAIGAHLSPVNVGVAILATMAHVRENHLDVTLCTSDGSVHATQWVFCLIVVELGHRADGPPRTGGVAVLTRNIKIAVRAVRTSRGLRSCTFRESKKRKNNNEHEFRFYPSAHDVPLALFHYPQ